MKSRVVSDGWYKVHGYLVYVVDCRVRCGRLLTSFRLLHPYVHDSSTNSLRCASDELSLSAFRKRLDRGTAFMC